MTTQTSKFISASPRLQFDIFDYLDFLYHFQNTMLEFRVTKPLQSLLATCQGPSKLITKRQDKHLDYSTSRQKYEKNKDPMRAKPVS